MPRSTTRVTVLLSVCGLVGGLCGCIAASTKTEVVQPAQDPAAQAQKEKEDEEKKAAEAAKKERQRNRKQEKIERSLGIAKQKLEKAKLALDHAETQHQVALEKAMADLEVARRKLEKFEQHDAPSRIERAELNLRRAEDSVTENQEELTQLEMLYSDEEFADKTKEIVIERAKRRLDRSRRDLALRRADLDNLKSRAIPIELSEHQLKVQRSQRGLEKIHRTHEATQLDKLIGVMNAKAAIAQQEAELAALAEEREEDQE